MFSGKLGAMKHKWGHSSSFDRHGYRCARTIPRKSTKSYARRSSLHHRLADAGMMSSAPWMFTVSLRRWRWAGKWKLKERVYRKGGKGGISGCKSHLSTHHLPTSWQPLLIEAVFPCRGLCLTPMLLWPALDDLIEPFFHHEHTLLFFFYLSTHQPPQVTGGIQSSPAASGRSRVMSWTSQQFYPREQSTLVCTYNLKLPLRLMYASLYRGWTQEYLEQAWANAARGSNVARKAF